MHMMMNPEMFKEGLTGAGLYKLELEKSRLQQEINNSNLSSNTKDIYKQYLVVIDELIVEETNAVVNREPFKLFQLKYTKFHWMSGEITNGCPVTTSIEIKPEILENKLKVNVIHKYMLEDSQEEKTINKQYDLPSQIMETLVKDDLRDLKNNYFSDDKIQKHSHWELEYNNHFKISGTFDQVPKAIKKITDFFENMISDALKVSME